MKTDTFLKVKLGPAEIEMKTSLIDSLFPRFRRRSEMRDFCSKRIQERMESGSLEEEDVELAKALYGEEEAKYINKMHIAQRTKKLLESSPPLGLLDSHESHQTEMKQDNQPTFNDDWRHKFWDDASTVSDEMMQEVYARILRDEINRPGSYSMRTLRVLRYMDRNTAELFSKIVPFILNDFLPGCMDILGKFGVRHEDILELQEVGLLKANEGLQIKSTTPISDYKWDNRLIRVEHHSTLVLPVRALLSQAGKELLGVPDVTRDPAYFSEIALWIASRSGNKPTLWAELSIDGQSKNTDELRWTPVTLDERSKIIYSNLP